MSAHPSIDYHLIAKNIKTWGKSLGFQKIGISDVDLKKHESKLQAWLDNGFHGDMQFMAQHGMKRARPDELIPGTLRVISVRLDYLPPDASFARTLADPELGYISRYALGRDYHKVLRNKLKKLGQMIQQKCDEISDTTVNFRPFVDSAPVLEHAIAEKAGIGWTGKHSLTLSKEAGSWFFLGELFINLPLPVDIPVEEACGTCNACMTICPTQAIVAPYVVDARRCISYLTIELKGAIPEEFRPLIGNRIYGCDDCQLICPWNRYAQLSTEQDFSPRSALKDQKLLTLFEWDESTFLQVTEGSPIRRIGYESWQRNLAVAIGNAGYSEQYVVSLRNKRAAASPMVQEHIDWALARQLEKQPAQAPRLTKRLLRSIEKGLPRDA